MGTTNSYLIPLGDLSLAERQGLRANADEKLTEAALKLKIRDLAEDLVIRDTLPNTDLGVGIGGPAVGAGTNESWLDQIAGVDGTEHQYFSFQIVADACIGFFGLSVETPPGNISRVRLTQGPTSTQVRGVYQLEKLFSRLETGGYFSEIVKWIRRETVRVMVMPRGAFAILTERLAFEARTIEAVGTVISSPST